MSDKISGIYCYYDTKKQDVIYIGQSMYSSKSFNEQKG